MSGLYCPDNERSIVDPIDLFSGDDTVLVRDTLSETGSSGCGYEQRLTLAYRVSAE